MKRTRRRRLGGRNPVIWNGTKALAPVHAVAALDFPMLASHAAVDHPDMATLSRRQALAMLGAGRVLLGLGYALRSIIGEPRLNPLSNGVAHADGPGFGGATSMDMSMYMEMFMRHNEIRRTVEEISGGVRTTTESDSPDLAALLHEHVPSMYSHLDQGGELMCMSQSLPTCSSAPPITTARSPSPPRAWSLSKPPTIPRSRKLSAPTRGKSRVSSPRACPR